MRYRVDEAHQVDQSAHASATHNAVSMPQTDLFGALIENDGKCELFSMESLADLEARAKDDQKKPVRKTDKYELIADRLLKLGNLREYRFDGSVDKKLSALADSMPNYRPVIDMVEGALCYARRCDEPLSLTPILLDGPPGIGKSYFANRLAEALSVPYSAHDMASASNSACLAGSDSHWGNAEPGDVLATLVNSHHISPVFVLDELDKAPSMGNSMPRSALYSLLEPENSRRFRDRCLPVTVNASHAIWIATTNNGHKMLEPPLLTRFQCFDIAPPSIDQRHKLAETLLDDALKKLNLGHIGVEAELFNNLASMNPRRQKQCLQILLGQLLKSQQHLLTLEMWPDYMSEYCEKEVEETNGIGFLASL